MAKLLVSPDAMVRVTTAILLGIHGAFRAYTGGFAPFGEYLQSRGIPFGAAVAIAITVFEIIGTFFLLARRFVIPVALGHIAILIGGIIMVHGPEGWFVVGGGRNGVEYSVLLLACLSSIILAERQRALVKPD